LNGSPAGAALPGVVSFAAVSAGAAADVSLGADCPEDDSSVDPQAAKSSSSPSASDALEEVLGFTADARDLMVLPLSRALGPSRVYLIQTVNGLDHVP
jgi:hypothetical protein